MTLNHDHIGVQESSSTEFGPHEGGVPDSCQVCEAPKLGSESVANFGAGPGVPPNRRTIR